MADKMRPVPFVNLLDRIVGEYRGEGSIFSIHESEFYTPSGEKSVNVFSQKCVTPLGPAAGPHTQLAQNIIAAYLTGSRFIELKTVQIMDTLEIAKPCIDARDEGYNVEWSTEYTLPKAYDEYLKAWIILHVIETLQNKGKFESPSFIFNMSVGYNLEGIKTERMQKFINSMLDADVDGRFDGYIGDVKKVMVKGYLDGTPWAGLEESVVAMLSKISKRISPSVTISTMHGCPPKEIEAICTYMLTEKKIDTFVKLNPTLLGFDGVRGILNDLGYTYVGLKRESFDHDLQYPDAVAMLHRLVDLAAKEGRGFGVKLTNTLGSVNDQGVLPGDEMYMSGRTLLPISTSVALKLSEEFNGALPVSYSGGANALTVRALFEAGIRPITLATDMLKPGGYNRMGQLCSILSESDAWDMKKIDVEKLRELNTWARDRKNIISKDFRGKNKAKTGTPLTLTDCYVSPCVEACPIHQDIPEYVQLMGEGKVAEALAVILDKNALPNITGWICDHQCQNHCTRLDYEGPVKIREMKRLAAEEGLDEYLSEIWVKPEEPADVKAAVVGAGPAGLSAALFLARAGFKTEIFEREKSAGGVVSNIIPEFRIPREIVERDVNFILNHGVDIHYGVSVDDVKAENLKKDGYDYIFYAIGAEKENKIRLEGDGKVIDAVTFLGSEKKGIDSGLGKDVVVVGGGNTAMDAARAALRTGAKVTVVYRRSFDEMPADREEYEAALADGVSFAFLTNPKSIENGVLTLSVMKLGEKDRSGRRRPEETGEVITLPCSALITATGNKPDTETFQALGVEVVDGFPTDGDGVYIVGDSLTGPTTVVRCIASARDAVSRAIDDCISKMEEDDDDECDCHDDDCCCHDEHDESCDCGCHDHHHDENCDCGCHDDEDEEEMSDEELEEAENEFFQSIRQRKSKVLRSCDKCSSADFMKREACRCVECSYLCNKCVEVCPNRANMALDLRDTGLFDDPFQILHIDAYCNECGNCATFCPHDGGPYLKKFTLFSRQDDFENSTNSGFLVDGEKITVRVEEKVMTGTVKEGHADVEVSDELSAMIDAVLTRYSYLLNSVEE
ncbi:MAG: putative selenate reductase subunit YgfK [Bullifex sp.]